MKEQNNRAEGRRAEYEERKQWQGLTQEGAGMENTLEELRDVCV